MKKMITLVVALCAATPSFSMDAAQSEAVGKYFQAMMNCGEDQVGMTQPQKTRLALMMMRAMEHHSLAFERGQTFVNDQLSRVESCVMAIKGKELIK